MTWPTLVGPAEQAGVTNAGIAALSWALTVHEQFFGQSWLNDGWHRRDIPFMGPGLWPVRGRGPVLRFVERACLLALVEPQWPQLQSQGRGLPPSEVLAHLRLVLEMAGMAIRAGLAVEVEPVLPSGRHPDLLLDRAESQVLMEVTQQSQDRDMRATEWYGQLVDQHRVALEREHGVIVEVLSEDVLDEVVVGLWFARAALVAADVVADGSARDLREGRNVLTVHPPSTVLTRLHEGPTLFGDTWPRIARRLVTKAEQTKGGPAAWIRIEVDPTLFALTSLARMNADERLRALSNNVAEVLADAHHVLGVLLGPAPGPGSSATVRLTQPVVTTKSGLLLPPSVARSRALASGPSLLVVALPGGWTRVTYVLPNPAGAGAEADPLQPGLLLGVEGTWLDWALKHLGQPTVAEML